MTDNGATPEIQLDLLKHVGIGQASNLAAASQKAKKATARNATDAANCANALLRLQVIIAQAKIDLLDDIARLADEDKVFTIFDLIDKEGSGLADAHALAQGLLSIGGDTCFVDRLTRVAKSIDMIDVDHDGRINCSEFRRLLNIFRTETGCTVHEVAELLVTHVAFPDIVEAPVLPSFEDRVDALFMLFDANGDGQIDKKEVSAGFADMVDDMDEQTKLAWGALLLVHEGEGESILPYPEFVELLRNIAAVAQMEFHQFADTATLALCRPKNPSATENLTYLFSGNEMTSALLAMEHLEKETGDAVDAVQFGRMQRLFTLWDLDHNGYIDLSEMLFGMRKFQEVKHMSNTVEECVSAMLACDTDDDAKLDVHEFSGFLVKFAKATGVSIQELVDFMIVTSALKDNNDAEQEYIETIGKKGTEAIMRRKGKRMVRSILFRRE